VSTYPQPGITVEPPSPTKVARQFHTASEAGRNRTTLDDPMAAGHAHSRWAVAGPNAECVAAWREHLHELGESARSAARAITTAMDGYLGTDESVGARLGRDARWLEDA
jgi:hypothetical protein